MVFTEITINQELSLETCSIHIFRFQMPFSDLEHVAFTVIHQIERKFQLYTRKPCISNLGFDWPLYLIGLVDRGRPSSHIIHHLVADCEEARLGVEAFSRDYLEATRDRSYDDQV